MTDLSVAGDGSVAARVGVLHVWATMLAVDGVRYALPAGAAFMLFWVWGRERFRRRLVQGFYPSAAKMLHDVRWSLSTVVVFSLFGTGAWFAGRAGLLRRYEDVGELGWAWFALSAVLLIVLQDTYFYWTHRAMHAPRLYRVFHRTHHVSTNPSPWTAYAFAPAEATVHAAFVPLAWLVLPLHQAAVFLFLLFMVVRNVLGHLSIELYPSGFTRSRFWGWHTTTTHHALHHKHFRSNYGLYFTFWDRLMKTTHAAYDDTFERVGARSSQTQTQASPLPCKPMQTD
jgi:Delta7-sterol 5-desaturase